MADPMSGMALGVVGGLMAGIGSVLGDKKVKIPEWKDVSASGEMSAATREGRAALPEAEKLVSSINAFQTSELMKGLDTFMPGARAAASANILSLLEGRLPESVTAGIARSAAAKNLGLGTAGSGFGRNLTLRDLGIGTLQGMQMGQQGLMQMAGLLPTQASVQSWLFNPAQRAEITAKNNEMQWQIALQQAQVDAQPSGISRFLVTAGSTMAGVGMQAALGPKVPASASAGTGTGQFNLNAYMPGQAVPASGSPNLGAWG